MPPRIRDRIGERLFRRQHEKTGTPVIPLGLARQTWLSLMTGGMLLFGVAMFLWLQCDVDRLILVRHNAWRSHGSVAAVFKWVSAYGMSCIILVVLVHLLLAMRSGALNGAHIVYLVIIFSYGIGGITGDVLKEVFDRPRPFVEYADQITPLSHPATPSLPSGHATKSMALALPFVALMPGCGGWGKLAKSVVLSTAVAVGYARIVLGVHYLSDVLSGVAIAIGCLPLAVWAANRIGRRVTQERLNTMVKVWGIILFFLMVYLLALA